MRAKIKYVQSRYQEEVAIVLRLRQKTADMDIREAEIAQVEIEIMDKARISNGINFQNPDQIALRED